jgi:hypothetical protein
LSLIVTEKEAARDVITWGSSHAIGRKLVALGLSRCKDTIYQRLKKSEYLRAEFAAIEKHIQEQLVREDFPLARRVAHKALRPAQMSEKDKFPYVKLVYDKALANRKDKIPESPVSIGTIERLQVIMKATLEKD